MDNKNFYDWVMSHEKVYLLLYSPSRIDNTPIVLFMFGDGLGLITISILSKLMGRDGLFLKKRFLGLGKS